MLAQLVVLAADAQLAHGLIQHVVGTYIKEVEETVNGYTNGLKLLRIVMSPMIREGVIVGSLQEIIPKFFSSLFDRENVRKF